MSTDAKPLFRFGQQVIKIATGQVFTVLKNNNEYLLNFLGKRYISSHSILAQTQSSDGTFVREICHEQNFRPYDGSSSSTQLSGVDEGLGSEFYYPPACSQTPLQTEEKVGAEFFPATQQPSASTTQKLVSSLTSQLDNPDDQDVEGLYLLQNVENLEFAAQLEEENEVFVLVDNDGNSAEQNVEPMDQNNNFDLDSSDSSDSSQDHVELNVMNPFGDVVKNSAGEILEPGTLEFCKEIGERSRYNPKTRATHIREWGAFESWVKQAKGADTWNKFLNSTLDIPEADSLLAGFVFSRYNKTVFKKTKKVVRLDPKTMGPLCSKLNKMVAEFTLYRPQHDSRFEVYKSNTSDYCKQSALRPGAGQLMNTMDPITAAELAWILQSGASSLWRPKSLVQRAYILIVVIFNLRAEETKILCFGNFKEVCVGGKPRYIILVPSKSKMRQGSLNAKTNTTKRPVAALSIDPEFNLSNVLAHLKSRMPPKIIAKYKDCPEDMPLWFEMKNVVKDFGEPFFFDKPMGDGSFNFIVKNAVIESGLSQAGRKIANSSLRISAFNLQEDLCIDAVSRQAFSGHTVPSTSIHYLRCNVQKNYTTGAAMTTKITGSGCVEMDWDSVYLWDGRKVYPRKSMSGTPLAVERDTGDPDEEDPAHAGEGVEQGPVASCSKDSGFPPVRSSSTRRRYRASPSARKFPFK